MLCSYVKPSAALRCDHITLWMQYLFRLLLRLKAKSDNKKSKKIEATATCLLSTEYVKYCLDAWINASLPKAPKL